jgi:tetratricopeptide (TPR) repeat protein
MSNKAIRDNFPARVRQILAERVAHRCSNPTCERLTIGPHSALNKALKLGRASHIRAAAPGGPRYDPNQDVEARTSINNGIWLCAICADLIDKDEQIYTVSLLLNWKHSAEAEILEHIQLGLSDVGMRAQNERTQIKIQVTKLLDEAFDALAGKPYSIRITWRAIEPTTLERVRRIIQEIATLDPGSERLQVIRVLYYLALGYPDKALEETEQIRQGSLEIEANLLKVRCLYDLGRTIEFIEILEQMCTDPKAPASAHYNLGSARLESGALDVAESLFRVAMQKDPNYPEAYDRLAEIAYRRGDLNTAVGLVARAYFLNPKDDLIVVHYALILLDQGRIPEAIEILESATNTWPGNAEILLYLGRAYGQSWDLDRAERYLRRALDLSPSDPIALHNLGVVLGFSGRLSEARKAFEEALKFGHPRPEEINGNLQTLSKLVDEEGIGTE